MLKFEKNIKDGLLQRQTKRNRDIQMFLDERDQEWGIMPYKNRFIGITKLEEAVYLEGGDDDDAKFDPKLDLWPAHDKCYYYLRNWFIVYNLII